MEYMDAEEYRKTVENHVIAILKRFPDNSSMPPERAKEIARSTLEQLPPGLAVPQIAEAAQKLSQQFPELASLSVNVKQAWG